MNLAKLPKRTFTYADDFYNLSEKERKALIGTCFNCKIGQGLYFPVQLTKDCFNYGIQEGLIYFGKNKEEDGKFSFSIGVSSPDDLDLGLDFKELKAKTREKVLMYVKDMPKKNLSYRDIMRNIKEYFNNCKFEGIIYED